MTELKPCPFCGDKIPHIWIPANGGYSVICGNGCGAEGPVMENEERAADAWNTRPARLTAEDREACRAGAACSCCLPLNSIYYQISAL